MIGPRRLRLKCNVVDFAQLPDDEINPSCSFFRLSPGPFGSSRAVSVPPSVAPENAVEEVREESQARRTQVRI
jgi:hypothetical protein